MVEYWAAALGLSLLLYLLLDGFDLGIGILFPFAKTEVQRRHMMDAISPVWDGNETWLIIAAASLFGVFPLAYSILLSAFYLPLIVMLCGLILRGVAFEFRHSASERMRTLWTVSFSLGSLLSTFVQGAAVGAFVHVLPVQGEHYAGGVFTWLTPFAVWCGFGLCLGYALLGACWLTHKTEGDARAFGYRVLPGILAGLGAFLAIAFIWAFAAGFPIVQQWWNRPVLLVFPAVAVPAGIALLWAVRGAHDRWTYPMAAIIMACAFGTIAGAVLPYIVPFSITLAQAAAPPATQAFMFWGAGLIAFPVTIIYTGAVYFIFRGKVQPSS